MITTGNCCFCAKLRTGSIIIGVLDLLSGIFATVLIHHLLTEQDRPDATPGFWAANAILFLVQSCLGCLLLMGIQKQNHVHVHNYLWGYSVVLIYNIVLKITEHIFIQQVNAGPFLIGLVFVVALRSYFLIVVYSYYREVYPELPN